MQHSDFRAVFFGDVSPKDKPGFYIKCVNNVYKKYAEIYNRKIPLIINTQGWVKGLLTVITRTIMDIGNALTEITLRSATRVCKRLLSCYQASKF